jgi:S-formylglutathione hydrolase FrmB
LEESATAVVASTRCSAVLAALVALAAALTGGCGAAMPDPQGARVTRISLRSAAVGRSEHVTVVVAPGRTPRGRRPLLVFLHGRGGDDRSSLKATTFAALRRLGPAAPVVAFPDGGDHSYWHDRADGAWARYVTAEVIPLVERRFRTDPRRVAIGGISMGGMGALEIAEHAPGRFCAVGAHSPALWQTAGETAPGAFDDARDFARHDVIRDARTDPRAFGAQPLRIDAGTQDPFLPGDRAFVAALRAGGLAVPLHTPPGGHDGTYWSSQWGRYLDFYAAALRACVRPAVR